MGYLDQFFPEAAGQSPRENSGYLDQFLNLPPPEDQTPSVFQKYIKPALDVAKVPLMAPFQLLGAGAGLVAPEAWQRATESNLEAQGPGSPNFLQEISAIPTLGQVGAEALLPGEQKTPLGRIAKNVGGLAADIFAPGAVFGQAAHGVTAAIEEAPTALESAAQALTGPYGVAAAFGPEAVQGAYESGKSAYEGARQGNLSQALEGGVQGILQAGLAGLMAKGIVDHQTAGRVLRNQAKGRVEEPPVQPEVKNVLADSELHPAFRIPESETTQPEATQPTPSILPSEPSVPQTAVPKEIPETPAEPARPLPLPEVPQQIKPEEAPGVASAFVGRPKPEVPPPPVAPEKNLDSYLIDLEDAIKAGDLNAVNKAEARLRRAGVKPEDTFDIIAGVKAHGVEKPATPEHITSNEALDQSLGFLGWHEDDIKAMDRSNKQFAVEHGLGPDELGISSPLPGKKAINGPARFAPRWTRAPVEAGPEQTEDLSKVRLPKSIISQFTGETREIARSDGGLVKAIEETKNRHGINLSLHPNGLEHTGSGYYHDVYKLGKATSGPFSGQDLYMRIGGSDAPIIRDKPWMLPQADHYKTANDHVVDIIPRTYSYKEAGKTFTEFTRDKAILEAKIAADPDFQAGNILMKDTHAGNFRYDKNGKLVVSDFGAVIPKEGSIARTEFTGPKAEATTVARKLGPRYSTPEEAKTAALETLKATPKVPTSVTGQNHLEGLKRISETTALGESRGIKTLYEGTKKDFQERGVTSLVGKTVDPNHPAESIAFLSQINRAPFEVHHTVAIKDGRIVEHFAYTSHLPGSVPISPEMDAQFKRLQGLADKGEIDYFVDLHNHPGGSPHPSEADIEGFNSRTEKHPALVGSVVIDHDQFAVIYPDGPRIYGYSKEIKAQLGTEDPHFQDIWDPFKGATHADVLDRAMRLEMTPEKATPEERQRGMAAMALLSRKTFGDLTAPRIYGMTNDGKVVGVQSVPMEVLGDIPFMASYLRDSAAKTGGGFFILHAQPGSAAESNAFYKYAKTLIDKGYIHDAFLNTSQEVFQPRITRSTQGFQSGPPRRVATEALDEEAIRAKAKAAARGVIEQSPNATEKKLGDPEKEIRAFLEPGDIKDTSRAKPQGSPDIALTPERFKEWDPELKTRVAAMAKELDSKLDRSDPKKWDRVAREQYLAEQTINTYMLEADKARSSYVKNPTIATKEAYEKALVDAAVTTIQFKDPVTYAARVLAAQREANRLGVSGKVNTDQLFMKRFMEALKAQGIRTKDTKALLEIYQKDPASFPEALRTLRDPKLADKMLEIWKAGLVSGPATRLANLTSNTFFRGLRDVENLFAGGIDFARAKITKTEQERFIGESSVLWSAYKEAFAGPEGAFAKWRGDKFGFTLKPVGEQFKGTFTDTSRANLGAVGGKLGEFIRIPFKGLEVDDALFKHLSAAQEAFRIAYRKAGGDKAKFEKISRELLDVARRTSESPYWETYKDDFETIHKTFLRDTFQAPLEGFFRALQGVVKDHPALQLLLPFVKTPTNIALETVRRTPLYIPKLISKALKGELKGGQLSEEAAKVAVGSLIGAGMAMAAYEGLISGGGPGDPRKEQLLRETGWQPYSAKIGDKWVSYQRLEPISSILGLAADFSDGIKARDKTSAMKKFQLMVSSLQENLTNKTFLSGLEGFFTFWHDPQQYGERWLKQMEGSLVPNVVGAAAKAVDTTQRKTGLLGEPILAKVPFASKLLPEQHTPTGEPKERPGGALAGINPLTVSEEKSPEDTAAIQELFDVGYTPPQPKDYMTVQGKRVDLTREELQSLEIARQRATQAFKGLMQSPGYKALPANEESESWVFGMPTRKDIAERLYRAYLRNSLSQIKPDVYKRAQKAS